MVWEGISIKDWIILGALFALVVLCMIVLVVIYRRKYMKTMKVLKSQAQLQLDRYITAEKETLDTVAAMRDRLQHVIRRHEKEKNALELQVHELKNQLKVLNASQVQNDTVDSVEIEKVKNQMEMLKEKHNMAIAEAEQEIEMLKGQLNALRWRI